MSELTLDTLRAAQAGDAAATQNVLEYMDDRTIRGMSRKLAAQHGTEAGEDAAQEARMAVWTALTDFEGETVADFERYAGSLARHAVRRARASEMFKRPVRGKEMRFLSAVAEAGGDYEAASGRGIPGEVSQATMKSLADELGAVVRSRDSDSDLTYAEAAGIARDIDAEDRSEKCRLVRGILDGMGEVQRDVLRYSWGIGGYPHYGHERGETDDAGLAGAMGTTVARVRNARDKGKRAFERRWIKYVAADAAEAEEWAEAARKERAARA